MKLLLDECLPVGLRRLLTGHDVFTVAFMGWKGIKNGVLLACAATDSFDALITTDAGIWHQQNLATLPLAVVIIQTPSNDLDDLEPCIPALLAALTTLAPNAVTHVQ